MKVFVTGATGFVGSAVVNELIDAGHQVLGLARSAEGAKLLLSKGAEVHKGGIEDFNSLTNGAAGCDAVIHTAFNHDFSKFKASCEADRLVIKALGSPLIGSDRPLIITSGIGILSPLSHVATENDRPVSKTNPRVATEEAADAVAADGVRVAVVRLPPTVHGMGDHGFVPMLINIAREKGLSVYKDKGLNYWPAVHRLDAATLYRLAMENNYSAGTRFHAVAEEGIAFRNIAEAIGKGLKLPAVSKSPEEAAEHFTWFAHFAGMDCRASAEQTKKQLGWNPVHETLLEDLSHENSYFA